MKDFFISYTSVDKDWAAWIAFILEEQNFSTVIQAWDFRPGSNFVLEMQRASVEAKRTILVLSPEYLQSEFASSEWAAAFSSDPRGIERKLVPVRIRACDPVGLLSSIVQIRLDGLSEQNARTVLIDGVDDRRAKPTTRPAFPGTLDSKFAPFPGKNSAGTSVIPQLKRNPTDVEKKRFVKNSFQTIKDLFEKNLESAKQERGVDSDFVIMTATEFHAELFIDGKSITTCRIWQNGMHSTNNICYSSDLAQHNGCNEILALADGPDLRLYAQMSMGFLNCELSFDLKNLTPENAAEYLWARFTSPVGTKQ